MLVRANASTGTPTRGNQDGEFTSNVYMVRSHVDVATRSHDYGVS